MVRKLVVGLASMWLVLVPSSVQALGFSNIQLNSSLNEPLDARIELLSPTGTDVETLQVELASEAAFTRAGIDRPHFLSSLQFEVVEGDGSPYIRVSSKQSIREPFVNFLLEFSWENGRMLREYTMLLDPPGQMMREPAPALAETPVTEQPADTIERYEPTPYAPAPSSSVEPAAPLAVEPVEPAPTPGGQESEQVVVETEPQVIEVSPEPSVATEMTTATPDPDTVDPFVDDGSLFPRIDISDYRRSTMEPGELDYGVTRQGDNAWTIAEKLQREASSASIYQIMMALLQSNPDAFVDGNIHRLKTGQVLRIEDASLLDAMSRQQAANEYMAQTESWNDYRQALAERTGRQAVVAEAGAEQAPVRAENGGELTLSSPDGEDLQSGAGASEEAMSNDLIALRDEMRQLRENASSTQERNVELNRQLQEMEEELARLQRSVSIKDDELAALQQQLAELNARQAASEAAPAEPAPAAPAEEAQVEPAPAEKVEEPEPVEKAETKPSEKPAPEQTPAPAKPPRVAAEPEAEPKGMVEEYLTMAKDIFNSAVEVVSGMISTSGNSLLMYVAAPVLLVLVILMLIVVRRRRQAEGNYQESILSGGPSTVTNSTDTADAGESSFLSDFAVSGAGAIQTEDSEVDPLTEADVFMAYGRYEAAEERLQEAIEQEPGRKELKLKLLELYSATGNSNAFENLAEEFYAGLGSDAESDPQWDKVVGMGKELAPNNPLFAAGATAAASMHTNEDPGVGLSDSQVMDIGLDTGVFESSDFAGGGDSPQSSSSDLDFNLDFGGESDTAAASGESDSGGGMDFNLDMGEPESQQSGGDTGLDFTPGGEEQSSSDLDFNLDTGGDTGGGDSGLSLDFDTGTEAPAQDEDQGLDFNLGGDDSGLTLDSGSETTSASDESMAFDAGSLDFGGADQGGMDLDMDTSGGDSDMPLGGGDEVGTKLDLARAYIDMGDPDGARSILDEVLDEGNDSQKQEAQQLLQQIA